MAGYRQCSDGLLNPGEECDDGNLVANDGCSPDCKLENPARFVCVNVTTFGPTECCPAKLNPITNQLVCSCKGQASDSPGYVISDDCRKVNINECYAGTATCHRNAVCEDRDATVNASLLYECICPPGLVGDGVTKCDIIQYETRLTLEQPGTTLSEFDEAAFKEMLYTTGAVPSIVEPEKVIVTVTDSSARRRRMRRLLEDDGNEEQIQASVDQPFLSSSESNARGGGGRALLQSSGIQITVTIYSESKELMSNVTSSVNTTVLAQSGFQVTQPPTNVVNEYHDGAEPTVTYSAGFKVTAVQFDDNTAQWLVDVRYTPNIPNTITSLYISKPGTTQPYTQAIKNSYYVSKHPCVIYNAVCCLNDYKSIYEIGSFSDNITSTVGTCNATVQASPTLGMFDPAYNSYVIEHALDNYPDSSVVRLSATEVRLRIAQTDLSVGGLAIRSPLENNPAGYQLSFFVGMTYMTLLDANAMSISASQTQITLAISNSITFSFSTSQDYSLVKYITLLVMQNKWLDGLIERKMQFIQMGFVIPVGIRQNMVTGLVPLTSVRFAIAKSMPDRTNASLWTNPCYSGYGRGLFDATQVTLSWLLHFHFCLAMTSSLSPHRATARCTLRPPRRRAHPTTTCAPTRWFRSCPPTSSTSTSLSGTGPSATPSWRRRISTTSTSCFRSRRSRRPGRLWWQACSRAPRCTPTR